MIHNLPTSLIEASRQTLENSLYESILLLEDRIDFLKSKNPVIDTSHDKLAIFSNPHEIIDHFATVGDPTSNKIYTPWILNQYKKKNIRQEDMYRVRDALSDFDKYKNKLGNKDINQYKSLSDIKSAVQPHIGTATTKTEEKQEIRSKGRTLIHQSEDGTTVYRLEPNEEGKKASQDIYGGGAAIGGTHTEWCTADRRDSRNMFHYYSKQQPLHTIHLKDGSVYQVHPETEQLMDKNDENVESDHENIHAISKALDHIPNGYSLKLKNNYPEVTKKDIENGIHDNDSDVVIAAVKHPLASEDDLKEVIKSPLVIVRASALKNPNVTPHIVHSFLSDEDGHVRSLAVQHPSNTKEVIDKMMSDEDYRVRKHAVLHSNASQETIKKGLHDSVYHVYSAAASGSNATEDTLHYALSLDNPEIDLGVANNKNATPKILDTILSKRVNKRFVIPDAQRNAAAHPKASYENLMKALDPSQDEGVQVAAIKNKNIQADHIDKVISNHGAYSYHTLAEAIRSPKATPSHISMMLDHPNELIRRSAIANPNVSSENISKALDDPDDNIKKYAIRHPNITSEHIDKVINNNLPTPILEIAAKSRKVTPNQIETFMKSTIPHIRETIAGNPNTTEEQLKRLSKDDSFSVRSNAEYILRNRLEHKPNIHNLIEDVQSEIENELPIGKRESKLPIEHVRDIINEHQKMGWKLNQDETATFKHPLTKLKGGGCQRSVHMKKDDNYVVLNIKFRGSQNQPHTSYKISRDLRTIK